MYPQPELFWMFMCRKMLLSEGQRAHKRADPRLVAALCNQCLFFVTVSIEYLGVFFLCKQIPSYMFSTAHQPWKQLSAAHTRLTTRVKSGYVDSSTTWSHTHLVAVCMHQLSKPRKGLESEKRWMEITQIDLLFYCPNIHDIKYKILIKQLQRQLAYEQLAKANLPMYRHTTHTSRVRCSQGISVRTSAALGQNHQLHFTLTLQMRHWNTTTSVWAPLLPGA